MLTIFQRRSGEAPLTSSILSGLHATRALAPTLAFGGVSANE
jgi:hypothetical protein